MSNLGRDAAVQHLLRGQTGGKQPNSPAHAISAGPFGFPPTKRQTPSFQPTLTPGKLDQTGRSASKASLMRRPLSPLPVPTRRRSGSHATTPVGAPRRPATRIPSSPLERTAFMPTAAKSRRTRTGCLTCRERHLKCDEGLPECVNCRKSSRECRRGMRLNFIDTKVRSPPHVPQTADWSVQFQDESRQIAAEYEGGLDKYPPTPPSEADMDIDLGPQASDQQNHRCQPEPTIPELSPPSGSSGGNPVLHDETSGVRSSRSYSGPSNHCTPLQDHRRSDPATQQGEFSVRGHGHRGSDASSEASMVAQVAEHSDCDDLNADPRAADVPTGYFFGQEETVHSSSVETRLAERNYLDSPEEVLYMQAFINGVSVWMDSLDKEKHFSRLIPCHALKSPMLLNSILACGAMHLSLVDAKFKDETALLYYDTATTMLLRSLQNPDRITSESAVTAVVLNVYEIMSEKPAPRMAHIAGARALIRECRWNAKSTGVGAACFWLNVGMEVLSCLAFNWTVTWDPDHWGLDMTLEPGRRSRQEVSPMEMALFEYVGGEGEEEVWVHRIFYIVAKIANFRAATPKFQEPNPHDEQAKLGKRLAQWQELKALCVRWNNCCPRTMLPLSYLKPCQTKNESAFPNIWLIKRAAIIGRLFYHTAQCLLAQTDPMESGSKMMHPPQLHHARQVCGIVAHTKDPGVSSVAIRSLAIAAAVLVDRAEQDEVIDILRNIHLQSGWGLDKVISGLKSGWGWDMMRQQSSDAQIKSPSSHDTQPHQQQHYQNHIQHQHHHRQQRPNQRVGQYQHVYRHPQAPRAECPISRGGGIVNSPTPPSMTLDSASSAQTMTPINPFVYGDFSHPQHPYPEFYEPPTGASAGPIGPHDLF